MCKKWKKIEDADVMHIWGKNCDCKGEEEIGIPPTFYEDNGTPMCGCGEDMKYLRTEIRTGGK